MPTQPRQSRRRQLPTRSTLRASVARHHARPGIPRRACSTPPNRCISTPVTKPCRCGHITARADANLAAVNYHFGGKDALIHAMLTRRLDGLNQHRLALLERFQSSLGSQLTCEHILGAMFIPALKQSRCLDKSGPALLRLLGRAYTDPSPFIRNFLRGIYADVAERFFRAFQTVLPHLPREELGWRLHFCIGSL